MKNCFNLNSEYSGFFEKLVVNQKGVLRKWAYLNDNVSYDF